VKTYFAFQDSQITEIRVQDKNLEIVFGSIRVISPEGQANIKNPDDSPIATLLLGQAKYAKLPKKGTLTDGELFGIPGKALNGQIPLPLEKIGDFEVNLCFEDKEFSIRCKSVQLKVDLTVVPRAQQSLH
jgi:hypothetical protein